MAQSITLELPEPPSLNRMIDLAKERTRRTSSGGWMKRSLPVVYDQAKERYELECLAAIRTARVQLPRAPWARWELVEVEFRLHNERDPLELLAGLKWTVDWLVSIGMLANDSTRELVSLPIPRQRVARSDRGITITIREVAA